jgi:TetR/AcrR family transcriptional repressor of nem operon
MGNRKEQILETAAELMLTRAFTAFSYQDISDRLGITKAAIHGHYRSKEMLGIALLEKILEDVKHSHYEAERCGDGAWDRFDAFMEGLVTTAIDENKVCPVCVLQVEHNVIQESMQRGVSKIYNLNRTWMAKILKQGRDEGVMIFQGSPEDQATLILAAIQGGLMNARAEEPEIFRKIVEQIKKNMNPV